VVATARIPVAAYCYRRAAVAWSVHPRGLLLQTRSSVVVGSSTRPISTDAQQWRGRSIYAVYCYRCASVSWSVHLRGLLLQPRSSVVWSVHLRGLLLQTRSCGVVGTSTRPTVTDAQQWRGLTIHATYCYWGCGRTTGWPTHRPTHWTRFL